MQKVGLLLIVGNFCGMFGMDDLRSAQKKVSSETLKSITPTKRSVSSDDLPTTPEQSPQVARVRKLSNPARLNDQKEGLFLALPAIREVDNNKQ